MSTDPTDRRGRKPGEALAALRRSLEAREPRRIAQDALDVDALTTRPQLEALADRLERMHADLLLGGQDDRHRARTALERLEDVRRAADVVKAAAVHGYPRPPLEQLGRQAEAISAARTSDPSTSHDARPPLVKRGNMLGKLLVAFLLLERSVLDLAHGASLDDVDATLTSEELAHRADLERTEYAKRCSDLAALGYIRVARDGDGHERTRRGASGRQRLVFELTDDGRRVARSLTEA